jgi:6-phosphogluconolactonase
MNTTTFSKEEDFIKESVEFIKKITEENPNAKIALSGGSTPVPIFKELAKLNLEAEFYQVDERYISSTDKDSNQKMIREALTPQNFNAFDTSLPIEESIKKYAAKLPEQFDLIILGIGPDGHTASLFPDSPEFTESVAHTQTDQFAVKDRLTLTFPTINKSKKLLVLLKGADKQNAISKFPANKLQSHPEITVHFTN